VAVVVLHVLRPGWASTQNNASLCMFFVYTIHALVRHFVQNPQQKSEEKESYAKNCRRLRGQHERLWYVLPHSNMACTTGLER